MCVYSLQYVISFYTYMYGLLAYMYVSVHVWYVIVDLRIRKERTHVNFNSAPS